VLFRTAWWRQHAVSAWEHLSWRQRPVWPNKHLRMRRLTLRAQQPMRSVTNYYQPRNVDMSVGARCELRGVMRPWFGFLFISYASPLVLFFFTFSVLTSSLTYLFIDFAPFLGRMSCRAAKPGFSFSCLFCVVLHFFWLATACFCCVRFGFMPIIDSGKRLWNYLFCVVWDVKPRLSQLISPCHILLKLLSVINSRKKLELAWQV